MLRHDERGVLDIELVGFIPALVIVLLLLLQGFLAVSTVTSTSAAARDGARALEDGRPAGQAVMASLPDSIRLTSVSSCGRGCVRVEATTPIGIPSVMEVSRIHLSAEADFPSREGD